MHSKLFNQKKISKQKNIFANFSWKSFQGALFEQLLIKKRPVKVRTSVTRRGDFSERFGDLKNNFITGDIFGDLTKSWWYHLVTLVTTVHWLHFVFWANHRCYEVKASLKRTSKLKNYVNAIDTIESSNAPTVKMQQLVESEKKFYRKILEKEQYKET